VALLFSAVFFIGPALAARASGHSLFAAIENSLGSLPAFALRICSVLFLILWIASLIAAPAGLYSYVWHLRDFSLIESALYSARLLTYLFVTGLHSLRTEARMAMFSNKLGIAVLFAALIRVHQGWPVVFGASELTKQGPSPSGLWQGLSELAFYVAPLALLATDFGPRIGSRRLMIMTGLMGIALPLFGTLFFIGVLTLAAFASPFNRPGLMTSVGMALVGGAARAAVTPRIMIATVTAFGAVRFGAGALAKTSWIRIAGGRWRWVWLGCCLVAAAWCSLRPYDAALIAIHNGLASCLAVTSANPECGFPHRPPWPRTSEES
jgi:hypothetical protein